MASSNPPYPFPSPTGGGNPYFGGQFSTSSTPGGVTDTKWHHIAYSFRSSDNTLSAAIDGVSASVSTIVPPPFNATKTTNLLFSNWDDVLVSGVRIVRSATVLPYYSVPYAVPTTPVGVFADPTAVTVLALRCVFTPESGCWRMLSLRTLSLTSHIIYFISQVPHPTLAAAHAAPVAAVAAVAPVAAAPAAAAAAALTSSPVSVPAALAAAPACPHAGVYPISF